MLVILFFFIILFWRPVWTQQNSERIFLIEQLTNITWWFLELVIVNKGISKLHDNSSCRYIAIWKYALILKPPTKICLFHDVKLEEIILRRNPSFVREMFTPSLLFP